MHEDTKSSAHRETGVWSPGPSGVCGGARLIREHTRVSTDIFLPATLIVYRLKLSTPRSLKCWTAFLEVEHTAFAARGPLWVV